MEETNLTPDATWSKTKLIVFRFFCSYLVIYNLPFPIRVVFYLDGISRLYEDTMTLLVLWVGQNILGLSALTRFYNGSGDTTFNYVEILTFFFLALLTTLIWSIRDLKVTNYEVLSKWLRVYLRFSLSFIMIVYGSIKVIKSQFPDPSLVKLIQPIGNSSPMGLVWTFMGASEAYCIFTGGAEMLAGILLAFPQTTTLGVLLSIGVISNIVMLNFSYDVPVKVFSSHLLMMSIFLIKDDLKRLIKLFIFNQTVEKAELEPLFTKAWQNHLAQLTKAVFLIMVVTSSLQTADMRRNSYGDLGTKSPLYGIWDVEEFEYDGKVLLPLTTDEIRWRRLIFDSPKQVAIHFMTNVQEPFDINFDPQRKIFLTKISDPSVKGEFFVEPLEDTVIKLTGQLRSYKIIAKLRKIDDSKFLLKSRGFNLVNEYPYNR